MVYSMEKNSTRQHELTAQRVAEVSFGLQPPLGIKPLGRGRINLSFLVHASDEDFILQRLNPVFGQDGSVVENVAEVTRRLKAAGLPAPEVRSTVNGRWWAEADGIWRLMTVLPGQTLAAPSVKTAAEAARILALFHRTLIDNPPVLKVLPPADYNRDSPPPPEVWLDAFDKYKPDPRFGRAAPIIEKGLDLARSLPVFSGETRAILHGDPKLDNFLFNENGLVTGLIDLDTVRSGTLLWELADFLRSWTGVRTGRGDKLDYERDIFKAAVKSYRRHGLGLTSGEWGLLPAAARAMALNLARRYLIDYFEETYFAWDRDHYPSLAEQNLRKGSGLISLAEDLATSEGSLLNSLD